MGIVLDGNPDSLKKLNQLAREQAKEKLLKDIKFDMTVCEIEGWDKMEYINELRALLDSLGGKQIGTGK